MIIVMAVTAVETTGDVFATGEVVGKRIAPRDIANALRADGLSTLLGGVLNSFPYTCLRKRRPGAPDPREVPLGRHGRRVFMNHPRAAAQGGGHRRVNSAARHRRRVPRDVRQRRRRGYPDPGQGRPS